MAEVHDYTHEKRGEFARIYDGGPYGQECKCGHIHPETTAGSRVADTSRGWRTSHKDFHQLTKSKQTSEIVYAFC